MRHFVKIRYAYVSLCVLTYNSTHTWNTLRGFSRIWVDETLSMKCRLQYPNFIFSFVYSYNLFEQNYIWATPTTRTGIAPYVAFELWSLWWCRQHQTKILFLPFPHCSIISAFWIYCFGMLDWRMNEEYYFSKQKAVSNTQFSETMDGTEI